jgi:ubiquitin carboxyl-terminal hydrolase 7
VRHDLRFELIGQRLFYDFGLTLEELFDVPNRFNESDQFQITIRLQVLPDEDKDGGDHSTSTETSRRDTGYIGLRNQGATCYMNSLLQALYHLPAFRRLVYEMPTNGTEDVRKSIPLNIQRLFYRMQFSENAVSTKALTVSFGWTDRQTVIQHDTQEFCRILIDRLSAIMQGTPLEGRIAGLFRGISRKYIRCRNVSFESERDEEFYDLSLTVQGCADLQQSFAQYVKAELLDGDNQYRTDDFGLQDALMGLEFVELPPILQLHLGRFQYNYDTDALEKINDRFEFPLSIDLTPFIAKKKAGERVNFYDLYGVLVHAGSVTGGHYYAFLRTSLDPQWFEFNDTSVMKVPEDVAVSGNFGGPTVRMSPTGYQYSTGNRSDSAYVLIYVRRDDAPSIFEPIPDSTVPEHLKEFLQHADVDDEVETSTGQEMCEFTCYSEKSLRLNAISGRNGFLNEADKRSLFVSGTATYADLYNEAANQLNKKPTEFHLWHLIQTPRVLISPSTTPITSLSHRVLFIQKGRDNLKPSFQTITIYVEFLIPTATSPIQYLSSIVVDYHCQLQALFPRLNELMGFPVDTPLLVSDVSSGVVNLDPQFTVGQLGVTDGSILAFEVEPSFPFPSTTLHIRSGIVPPPPIYTGDPLPLHTYATAFGGSGTSLTLFKYFTSVIDQAYVILIPFNTPTSPLCLLQFPTFISLQNLSEFIVRALNLDVDPDKDSILLFKKDSINDLPSRQWLQPQYFSCAKYAIPPDPTFQKLYFRIEKGVSLTQLNSLRWYLLRIAPSGITPSEELTGKLLPLNSTLQELIPESLSSIDPSLIRISSVFDNKLHELLTFGSPLPSGCSNLRIDVIPEDQRSLNPETEQLISVAFACPDSQSRASCTGDPFWFRIVKGESVGALRQRLETALAFPGTEFEKYELMLGGDWALIRKSRFLKPEDICWDEYEALKAEKGLSLLLIDRTFRPPRLPEEVLKIWN